MPPNPGCVIFGRYSYYKELTLTVCPFPALTMIYFLIYSLISLYQGVMLFVFLIFGCSDLLHAVSLDTKILAVIRPKTST